MVYISKHRAHDQDTRERREVRDLGERLAGKRARFIRYMDQKGLSREQRAKELDHFDRIVELNSEASR